MNGKTGKEYKRNWTPEQIEKQRKYGHTGGIQKGINASIQKVRTVRERREKAYWDAVAKDLDALLSEIETGWKTACDNNTWRQWLRDNFGITNYRQQTEFKDYLTKLEKEQKQKELMETFAKGKHPEYALLVPYFQEWIKEQQTPQRRGSKF